MSVGLQVVLDSLQVHNNSIARIKVAAPAAASVVNITMLADPCSTSSQPVNIQIRIADSAPTVRLTAAGRVLALQRSRLAAC